MKTRFSSESLPLAARATSSEVSEAGARPRLLRLCLKRGCRLGPLPREVEIDLAPSRIDRQLGRLGAILGVPLIHVLECRDVLGVILFVQLLQSRDHFFFLPYVLGQTRTPKCQPGSAVAHSWLAS